MTFRTRARRLDHFWYLAWAFGFLAVVLVTAACARGESAVTEPISKERAQEVLTRHRDALMARPGAVGVGVGKRELHDEDYVIVVYLASPESDAGAEVSVDGVPVVFRVTGRIHPQQRGVHPYGE
ncbi:MAG: hypothetical protein AAFY88_11420 [Acidobacteriota bacterium]